ncbi:MAG: hypothetical protein WCK96_02960 [Methylococcales bacterium]
MESSLIAKVLVPKTNGKNAIGTAYPISKNLIITARHVVDFPDRDVSNPISIIWTDILDSNKKPYSVEVSQLNILFNGGKTYDIVLIRCDIPIQVHSSLPISIGQHPAEYEKWKSMGYPHIGKEADGSRHKVSAMGEIFPPDTSSPILDLESKGDAKEKEGWQGISGAPVFVGNTLIAVITHTPNDINERLRAISIAYLLQHEPAFKELIYGSSHKNKYSADPSFLPYLLDREPQENTLIDTIAQYDSFNKPLLCIVSGAYDDCCSEKFVQRIARRVLPQVPSTKDQLKDDNYCISFVKTGDFKNKEQLHANIQRSLGESFAQNRIAKVEEIKKGFLEQRRPVLLYAALSTEDCQNCDGVKTLQHFLSFWQDWQIEQQPHYLIFVCLFFYYQPQESNFLSRLRGKKDLNSQIEQSLPNLNSEHCKILPKLEPIKDKHIEEWSDTDYVRNFFNRSIYNEDESFRKEIKKIYDEQKTKEIALGYLARKLIPVLQKLAPKS